MTMSTHQLAYADYDTHAHQHAHRAYQHAAPTRPNVPASSTSAPAHCYPIHRTNPGLFAGIGAQERPTL